MSFGRNFATTIIPQAGLDAAYDIYAFGREDGLEKGLYAAGGGLPVGIAGGSLGALLPRKYRLAGAVLGNFIGSIAGAEAGLRVYRRMNPDGTISEVTEEIIE
jgi:hypothetical protein